MNLPADFDAAAFWQATDYAQKTYTEPPPSDELIQALEAELGYTLPAFYVALLKQRNGGIPRNTRFAVRGATGWAADHIALAGICGIGRTKRSSLGGELGSQFMLEEWGYPAIGVVVCDCPSAGHDVVMLDYRACGPAGEPAVVHVDQENDYHITRLAPDFETFVRGLVNESVFAK